MGPPPETFRNQTNKLSVDRTTISSGDGLVLGQENRRPVLDRNGTRGTTKPDEIILGPPGTKFASATLTRNNRISGELEKGPKDSDRQDRLAFRTRTGDSDTNVTNDRFRDRNTRLDFRRRGDQDQDSDGWSTVKPRKSFGAEGAERFTGRMGGTGERFGGRDDRRPRDRGDERDNGDRRSRNLDGLRDNNADEAETPRRNGLNRGKTEPWFREPINESPSADTAITNRERIDRAKSWRDRDPDASDRRGDDRRGDRTNDKNYERRWDRDRDQRIERDPEWMDEPFEEKPQKRTEEDFRKFLQDMKAREPATGVALKEERQAATTEKPTAENSADAESRPAPSSTVDLAQDKFFAQFSGGVALTPGTPAAENKDSQQAKGNSKFMKFLTQEDNRPRFDPPTPATRAPGGGSMSDHPGQNDPDKEAFQNLLLKLQTSNRPAIQAAGPPPQAVLRMFEQHQVPFPTQEPRDPQPKHVASPESFQQYGGNPRMRALPQQLHQNLISPRQMVPPTQPPPVSRPEQALQELLAQRQNLPSQGSNRGSQNGSQSTNNTEFLMRLMQSHREAPEPPRPELQVRMPQPTKQVSLANIPDHEADYQRERERVGAMRQPQAQQQQQQMRLQQGPPGFMDEQFHAPDMDSRPQPTHILQRPPPPGLDHHGMHPFPMGGGGVGGPGGNQMPPPPQRPMIPPPGLGAPRNPNIPNMPNLPGMYPSNFPPQGPPVFGAPPPPHEGMSGPPPGAMGRMLPPPGFYGGPLQGFMPPAPPGMSPGGFQGSPDGPPGFPGVPFDRRGMLPPGYRGP